MAESKGRLAEQRSLFSDLDHGIGHHKYYLRNSEIHKLLKDDVYREILQTAEFRRLKTISFLGALDYVYRPHGLPNWRRHSRYQHTIGVANIVIQYARAKNLDNDEAKLLTVAALLHDIGHGPLSHTLEPVFKSRFSVDHHRATIEIVSNKRAGQVAVVLRKHGIDAVEVVKLLGKISTSPHASLFSGPLNVDTLEGISRSSTYLSPNFTYPSPTRIMAAMLSRRQGWVRTLDNFWHQKNIVYRYLIFGPFGTFIDRFCQSYMEDHIDQFSKNDFYLSEYEFKCKYVELFRRLRQLRRALYGARARTLSSEGFLIEDATARDFSVDRGVEMRRVADVYDRYAEEKRRVQKYIPFVNLRSLESVQPMRESSYLFEGSASEDLMDFPALARAEEYSRQTIERLRGELAKLGLSERLCVVAVGSFGRREASPESDLDYFLLHDQSVTRAARILEDIRAACVTVVSKEPSPTGAFAKPQQIGRLVNNIGGSKDDNANLTRRVLFLLESVSLYNSTKRTQYMTALMRKYIKPELTDPQIAMFFLNDVIRYWRTICVDFEFKTREDNKGWGIRNIKLVFSRKLLYFSGIIVAAEVAELPVERKIEHAVQLLNCTPLERIRRVCGDAATGILSLYNHFLEEFEKEDVRAELETVNPDKRNESHRFRALKDEGQAFFDELSRTLANCYAPNHLIHRALLF
jgi:uncharacterized protein